MSIGLLAMCNNVDNMYDWEVLWFCATSYTSDQDVPVYLTCDPLYTQERYPLVYFEKCKRVLREKKSQLSF